MVQQRPGLAKSRAHTVIAPVFAPVVVWREVDLRLTGDAWCNLPPRRMHVVEVCQYQIIVTFTSPAGR